MRLIGVSDVPPPPGASFGNLDGTALSAAWRDGAIAPSTFRALTGIMLSELPPESRLAIGRLLVNSVSTDSGRAPDRYQAFSEFVRLKDESLDKMPVAPIVGVNVNAPVSTILSAIEAWVRELKAARGIPERRRRDDKLPEYLTAWDQREGWVGDRYDSGKEKTFREIATDSSDSLSTVRNRYRSAFRYIVGHDYSPELWFRLFGAMKISKLIEPDARPRRALRRPWRSAIRRAEPESVVAPRKREGHQGSFVVNQLITPDMLETADLLMDIHSLFDRGRNNTEIADELELPQDVTDDLIDFVRRRQEDGI
jgi:hypothetical protein